MLDLHAPGTLVSVFAKCSLPKATRQPLDRDFIINGSCLMTIYDGEEFVGSIVAALRWKDVPVVLRTNVNSLLLNAMTEPRFKHVKNDVGVYVILVSAYGCMHQLKRPNQLIGELLFVADDRRFACVMKVEQ